MEKPPFFQFLPNVRKKPISSRRNPTLISSDGVKQASALCSTQEEADSRMLLHAAHANDTFSAAGIQGRIVIISPDTDVLVIAVHYFPQMDSVKELWIETGVVSRTTDLRRFSPVHDICRSHSPVFIILPAIHALTGCDSTSAFFGIGKKSVYTMVTDKGAHCFEALLFLGRQDEAVGIAAARKFIACLYDPKGKEISAHISMDILRAKFAAKRRDSSLAKLPPCEDSIKQHREGLHGK